MTGIGPRGEVARPELVLEVREAASRRWLELEWPYKPGSVARRPPLVAPYQPRLDWQMWFQALSPYPERWFVRLLHRIAEGSPAVLRLLDPNSLPDTEVDAVRVVGYTYRFTTYGETGWWKRTPADSWALQGRVFPTTPGSLNLKRILSTVPGQSRAPVVRVLFLALGVLGAVWWLHQSWRRMRRNCSQDMPEQE